MSHIVLIIVFLVATVGGYFIINNVPSLLHTPLMSGMNALSGITVLGALAVTAVELGRQGKSVLSIIFGIIAIILAIINVAGGFGVTARMLKMFRKKEDDE